MVRGIVPPHRAFCQRQNLAKYDQIRRTAARSSKRRLRYAGYDQNHTQLRHPMLSFLPGSVSHDFVLWADLVRDWVVIQREQSVIS